MAVIEINLEIYHITNKTHTQSNLIKSNSTLESVTIIYIYIYTCVCPIVTQQLDIKPYTNSFLEEMLALTLFENIFPWKCILGWISNWKVWQLRMIFLAGLEHDEEKAYVLHVLQRTWRKFEKFCAFRAWFNEGWESAEPLVHRTSDMLYLWLIKLDWNFTFRHFGLLKVHNGIIFGGSPSRVILNVFQIENKRYADQKIFCNGYL